MSPTHYIKICSRSTEHDAALVFTSFNSPFVLLHSNLMTFFISDMVRLIAKVIFHKVISYRRDIFFVLKSELL